MLKTRTIAILLGLLGALPALSEPGRQPSPPPDNDRVPNTDPWQMYPRWIRSAVAPSAAGGQSLSAKEIAVQSDGTVHLLLQGVGGTVPARVYYSSNRPEGRTANGFSAPFKLNSDTSIASIGAIAAGKDGRLTAAYLVSKSNSVGFWYDVAARQFDPVALAWGGEVSVTAGSASTSSGQTTTTSYGEPTLAYDDAGNVHMVYGEEVHVSGGSVNTFTRTIKYALNLGSAQTVANATGTANLGNFTGVAPDLGNVGSRFQIPTLASAPDGTPHALWTETDTATGVPTLYYSSLQTGTWSAKNALASDPGGGWGVATDESGGAHIAYSRGLGAKSPKYRFRPSGGTLGSEEAVAYTVGSGAVAIKVAVNARKKPVVVWSNGNPRTSCAIKVQNSVSDPNGWVEQFALDGTGENRTNLNNIAIDPRTGFTHLIFDTGGYVRSTEFNTGGQDGFTMVPFGPNATANLATGNLRAEVPLFNAQSGFGFGTGFSLMYNSLGAERGTISPGWSNSFDLYLEDLFGSGSPRDYNLHAGDGSVIPFIHDLSQGTSLARPEFGNFSKIDVNTTTGEYTLTTKFGTKYIFNPTGRLDRMEDTQSPPNTMRFTYVNGLLDSIQDSPSRPPTRLAYDSKKRLQQITDPAGNTYTLAYQTPSGTNAEPGNLETVTFDGAPSPQTVTWRFQYYIENNFDQTANPPVERHKGMLSDVFTPRGLASSPQYSYQFGYKLDGRVVSSTEPSEASVVDDTSLSGLSTSNVQARREIAYIDPSNTVVWNSPNIDEGADGTRVSPAAQVKDRRGNVTTIEYQAARCLADRVRDPIASQVLRRFFDTTQQLQEQGQPLTVPQYRNLKKVIDREGNTTQYFYTFEEGAQEMPAYVKDNLRRVSQPPANATDAPGTGGVADSIDTATYAYKDFFARVASVKDALQNTTTYDYDAATGNLLTITYPSTGVSAGESFTYDGLGRVTSHTAPESGVTNHQAFDSPTGLVTSLKLPDHANPELFQYDLMGNATQHTLPEGGLTIMAYDNLYRLHEETPPAGGSGDTVSQKTTYTYNEDFQVIQVDAPENSSSTSVYDTLRRLTQSKVKSATGTFNTFYKYDRDGNAREVKDPNGKSSTSIYDALSRVVKSQNPGPPFITTETTYNLNGAVATQKVGGSTTTMTYSGRGMVLKSSNGGFSSQTDQTHYFEDGTVDHSSHQVNGVITNQAKNGYDNRRRLTSTLQVSDLSGGMGFTTFYTLDKNGNRTAVTDPEGRITYMEYDKADRQTVTRDHNLVFLSRNIYDSNDRVSIRTKADAQTGAEITDMTYAYNARNELKTQTDANNQVTQFFYDARGNQLKATPPATAQGTSDTVRIYDVAGRLVQETRAAGTADQAVWLYEYDANGNRTKITDPRNFVYLFQYDEGNRLTQITYPTVAAGTFIETWTYDDRGNRLTHTDPNGKVATMTYDLLNRQKTEVQVANAMTVANLQKDYDERGNLAYVWDSGSQILVAFAKADGSTAYDALGRLTEVNWYLNAAAVSLSGGTLTQNGTPFGRVRYQDPMTGNPGYDGAGNLTDMIDPQGNAFHYSYDMNGRLTAVQRTHSGTQSLIAQISYYASGLKKDVTYLGGSKETRTYDLKYRLQSIVLTTPSPSPTEIGHIIYDYDERDRVRTVTYTLLNRLVTYTYDQRDRLKSEQWTSGAAPPPSGGSNNVQDLAIGNKSPFTDPVCATPSQSTIVYTANWFYDASGNRTSKSVNGMPTTEYEYDEQNRLLDEKRNGAVVVSYGYDKNGNQTSRTENSVVETFTYDYRNRVKAYTKGSVSYTYLFTPTAERIAKVNVQTASNVEEWYMYDGQDVTADYTRTVTSGNSNPPPPTLVRTYVNGRAIDSKIARIESNEAVYFYSGDSIGSVHEMITTAGAIARRSLYTAWGEDLGDSNEISFADRYVHVQREDDPESGTKYFRARNQDPRTGRFIQTDPLKEQFGTIAPYVYALNAPTFNTDPTGTFVKGDHEEITREAFENVVSRTTSLLPLTDKQGRNRILYRYFEEKLVLANTQTDTGALFDDLKRHFNADPNKGPEHIQQMKRAFESHMDSLARDIGALQGSSPVGEITLDEKQKSMRMLRLMGYMLHSIQDFYAHGVDEVAHPREGKQNEVTTPAFWDFFSQGKTTSPFNPTGLRPSTYTTWGFGEHPGRTLPTVGRVIGKLSVRKGGEPALSDLEYQARKKGALRSSEEALERYFGKWGEVSLNLGWKLGIIGGEISVDGERLNMLRAP